MTIKNSTYYVTTRRVRRESVMYNDIYTVASDFISRFNS